MFKGSSSKKISFFLKKYLKNRTKVLYKCARLGILEDVYIFLLW